MFLFCLFVVCLGCCFCFVFNFLVCFVVVVVCSFFFFFLLLGFFLGVSVRFFSQRIVI